MIVKYELWMFELWAAVGARGDGVSARPSLAIHTTSRGESKAKQGWKDKDDDDMQVA